MDGAQLKDFLDQKVLEFSNPDFFIPTDAIQIPWSFDSDADREIAGFIAALIAWGQRPTIIKNANKWMDLMDREPKNFLLNASEKDFSLFNSLVHRTLNGEDAVFITRKLSQLIREHGSINDFLKKQDAGIKAKIQALHNFFNTDDCLPRTAKHIANPAKGSAAKRLIMYFRWMVRKQNSPGADFGIWDCLSPSELMLPLDIHTGNISTKLGLLKRKQSDWKAVEEVSSALRKMDPHDPIKYDYALFGLGAFEGF